MRGIFALLFLILSFYSLAQDTSENKKRSTLRISGYADIYYQNDFNKPVDKLRPPFLYNFKKHDEVNINLALVKAAYTSNRFRGNIGIMTGNNAKYNLVAEAKFFRHIYEANVGYKFSEKISVDAGIFPSHIGCESAIAKDNWNLSQSMPAENSPYYETGIKLNYKPDEKWTISFFVLNGWQNIKDYNSSKAIGTQVVFKPNENWVFNSSSFIGNEKPDSAKQLRLFHNLHITYNINTRLKTLFMLDLGSESKIDRSGYNKWMGTAVLLQYIFSEKISVAGRYEFYRDPKGVIVSNYLPKQFKTTGYSVNLDYNPSKNIILRSEARFLDAKDKIFAHNDVLVQSNFSLLFAAAFYF